MRMKELIEGMGSIIQIYDKPYKVVPKERLAKYLDTNNPVFNDYFDYLAVYGGETFLSGDFRIKAISNSAEYFQPNKPWHFDIDFGGVDFGCVFGEGPDFREGYTISYNIESLKDRIPEGYIPISVDDFGCYMLLCTAGENIGKIYFWDREHEVNEAFFFERHQIEMPPEVKFRNMFCIGENLYDCFQRMEKSEDDE